VVRKSKPNRKRVLYKDFVTPRNLRVLVELIELRKSKRFRLKHGEPHSPRSKIWIRGEVFENLLIPSGYDFVIELYKDEIRRWIAYHFPELKDKVRQMAVLERFVWSLIHEVLHILEMNGNLEFVFKGGIYL